MLNRSAIISNIYNRITKVCVGYTKASGEIYIDADNVDEILAAAHKIMDSMELRMMCGCGINGDTAFVTEELNSQLQDIAVYFSSIRYIGIEECGLVEKMTIGELGYSVFDDFQ